MKLTGETKLFIGILVGTVILIAGAAFIFSKPTPTISREALVPKDAHTKGNPQAKAYLVEFSDFQCPACKAAKPTVDALTNLYKDKLLYVYRNYPLSQHEFSQKAAAAAEAAANQNKYWEMFDLLFANQENFSDTEFDALAKQLNLDISAFNSDMSSEKIKNRIRNDQDAGNQVGVDATPTFFLNGQKLNLNSFDDLINAVKTAVQ